MENIPLPTLDPIPRKVLARCPSQPLRRILETECRWVGGAIAAPPLVAGMIRAVWPQAPNVLSLDPYSP